MKKITIVYERNEETNAIELRTIVIFDEGKAPIVRDYHGKESLYEAADFAESNGYDVLEESNVRKAIEDGLINIISRANTKAMAELKAEILQETAKYGFEEEKINTNEVVEEKEEKPKTKRIKKLVLSDEDKGLAEYFKLDLERNKRELTKEELGHLIGLARENERVRALEEAKTRLENGEISQKEYETIRDTYRAQLAEAFKNAETVEVEVPVEEVSEETRENPEEQEEMTTKTIKVKQLNLSKEDRDFVEYLKLVILRNKRELTEEEQGKLLGLVKDNEKARVLEDARAKLEAGSISQTDYETIHAIFRAQLAEAIKNAETVEVEKVVEVPAKKDQKVLKLERNEEPSPIVENPKVKRAVITPITEENEEVKEENEEKEENQESIGLNISKEDRDLANYLKLDLIRRQRELTEEEQGKLLGLVKENERARALEEAKTQHDSGSMTDTEYNALHDKYRAELAKSFRAATEEAELGRTSTEEFSKEKNDEIKDEETKEAEKTVEIVPEAITVKSDEEVKEKEEEREKGPVIPGIKLVKEEEGEKEAKDLHPIVDGETEIVNVPEVGDIEVKKSSWWKRLIAALGAIGIGVLGTLGIQALVKKNDGKLDRTAPPVTVDQVTPTPAVVVADNTEEPENKNTPEPKPTQEPTQKPTQEPTQKPTQEPTQKPTQEPTQKPTQEPTQKPTQEPTQKPSPSPIVTMSPDAKEFERYSEAIASINSFCDFHNVPDATRAFLQRQEVLEYVSQFTNADQRGEVLSALCYGYEANILTTKDGNFRLDKDGNNYLTSFTSDFLCAKVVVNRYSAKQMKTVFGNSDVSYEQIMSGFQNYCYTVTTYGMNAEEPLPFHYLTNNNKTSTPVLNDLFEKLIVVNTNRENKTLTSEHTDDFIATVFDIFVVNDGSLNLSQGTKSVLGAMIKAYTTVQAQIANGEPLYLHENRGYARAGINLSEVDGEFAIQMPDKTTYQFTSLYDVINHGYGDKDENAARCLSEQEVLLSNINAMGLIENPSPDASRLSLAVYLEEHGLSNAAREIRNNTFDAAYLYNLANKYPQVAAYINSYLAESNKKGNDLHNFEEISEKVDQLVGVSSRNRNNYADLINNRRSMYSLNNDYTVVSGKRYVSSDPNKKNTRSTSDSSTQTHVTTTVTETHEQITVDQMTPEEKHEAQEQVEKLKQEEEKEHKEQEERIKEGVQDLREAVEQGVPEEKLEEIAEDHGITLDPDYQENMEAALEEQRQGEEERARQEAAIEERNRQAEAEAAARREEEERRQAAEAAEQQRLIEESLALENPETPAVDEQVPAEDFQTDSDRVDVDAGEEDYIPDSASIREQLNAMKRAALSLDVDIDSDSLDRPFGPRLG